MHRPAPGLVLLLFALLAVPAAAQQLTAIEIIQPGIYTTDVVSSEGNASGIARNIVENERLALATTTIPLTQGVKFGFHYKPVGPLPGFVRLQKVILLPRPGLRPPGKPPVLRIDNLLDRRINETSYTEYSLDDVFELVPGQWTFQLWWNNRKMAEQSFTLVVR